MHVGKDPHLETFPTELLNTKLMQPLHVLSHKYKYIIHYMWLDLQKIVLKPIDKWQL